MSARLVLDTSQVGDIKSTLRARDLRWRYMKGCGHSTQSFTFHGL